MDSIRRFIANFQKHGTISWSLGKKVKVLKNIVNITKEPEGNLFKDDIHKQNPSTIQDATENSEKVDASSPEIMTTDAKNYATIDTESNCFNIANTSECLAEFNEILQEKNTDIHSESVTLEEIDDVLNEMTEGNECPFFNIPRFDLHNLVENFGFFENDAEPTDYLKTNSDENIEAIDIDFIGPGNLNEDLDEAFDADQLLEQNIKKPENSKDFIEKNIESPDIISISSEDSQVNEQNVQLLDDKEVFDPINIKLELNNERDTPNELRNVFNELNNLGLPFQDEILEDFNIDSTQNNLNKETKKTNLEDDKLNFNLKNVNERDVHSNPHLKDVIDEKAAVKIEGLGLLPQDVVNFYSKDKIGYTHVNKHPETVKRYLNEESKYQEVPFAYDFNRNQDNKQDESKINIDPKNSINMIADKLNNSQDILSIKDSDETESVNDKNEKQINTTSKEIDSDDCGYLSSDFEFITEDEAKLDGLIVNVNPNITKKLNKLKKVKTIEISVDRYSNFYSSESSPESMHDDSNTGMHHTFDLQSSLPIDPQRSNFTRDFDVQENRPIGLRSFRRNKDTYPILNWRNSTQNEPRYGSGCKDLFTSQQNCTGPNNVIEDCPGERNIGENQSVPCDFGEFSPELNDLGNNPGPSNISQRLSDLGNRPRPNILRGNNNCPKGPETSNDDIKKWRAFQKKRRNQFFLDHRYREHHLVPSNEDYHQLFNPNYLPLPNQSMRLENKSTLSISTMLIEYDGVGFDMQMMRGNSESEEEEVKQEAAACARRILQMYPRENRKRRRSRRF